MKFTRIGAWLFAAWVLPAAFCPAPVTAATTNPWTNTVGSLWRVATNWAAAQAPSTSHDLILITNAGTKIVTIDSATPAGNLSVRGLTVSAPAGSTNTLALVNVPLGTPLTTAGSLIIDRRGALQITNSALVAQSAFDLNAGSFVLASGAVDATQSGGGTGIRAGRLNGETAAMTLSGGTLTATRLTLGSISGSQAILTLAGGNLVSTSDVSVAQAVNTTGLVTIASGNFIVTNGTTKIGDRSFGTFTQNGGNAAFAYLSVGDVGVGKYSLTGGQMAVTPRTTNDLAIVGNLETGEMDISGGIANIGSELHIADFSGVTGTVRVTEGTLIATNDLVAIGRYGIGSMTVTNALVTFTNVSVGRHDGAIGTLTVQSNASVFLLADLSIGRLLNATGHVVVTGGLLSLTNDDIWVGRQGVGDLTVSNGTVRTRAMWVGMSEDGIAPASGAVTLVGGQTVIASNLVVGTPALCSGQMIVGGGSLIITNDTDSAALQVGNGSLTFNQGTLAADHVLLTNDSGQLTFNGGLLKSKGTEVANSLPFVVGDGIKPATFLLLGGTHSFAGGLVINTNATLAGCGTILGVITNHGTLANTNCGSSLPPSITQSPTHQIVLQGSDVTFTVTADGTPPLGYQWRFNSNNLVGATSNNLTLTNVQKTNAGAYDVIVSNHVNAVTSSVAVLTVLLPPAITDPPTNLAVLLGGNATFSVSADGTPPLGYQWRFNSNDLAGATSTNLTLTHVQTTNAGHYQVVVTNAYGSVTSAVATLSVVVAPRITGIALTGTTATVSFTTFTSSNHMLEYREQVIEYTGLPPGTNWTAVPPAVIGTGGIMNKQDTSATNGSRWYRIHLQ